MTTKRRLTVPKLFGPVPGVEIVGEQSDECAVGAERVVDDSLRLGIDRHAKDARFTVPGRAKRQMMIAGFDLLSLETGFPLPRSRSKRAALNLIDFDREITTARLLE
jgi:hypothetical protein